MASFSRLILVLNALVLTSSIFSVDALAPQSAAGSSHASQRKGKAVRVKEGKIGIALQPHGAFIATGSRTRELHREQSIPAVKMPERQSQPESKRLPPVIEHGKIKTDLGIVSTVMKAESPWRHAILGGLAGMGAGLLQVLCLLWLRTALNRQYYYGGSLSDTFRTLWAEGGISRFYEGLGWALLQAPLARFSDTFVQSAVVAWLGMPGERVHGFSAGVIVATIGAFWRLAIAPLDTLKVTCQVHGSSAGKIFTERVRSNGIAELWSGATAMFLTKWVGSLPWWGVYNTVLEYWPQPTTFSGHIIETGVAGIFASMASDVASNAFRVLRVKRMAAEDGSVSTQGYLADAKEIIASEGAYGLLFRGIGARLLVGALNGAFFSILWNLILASFSSHPILSHA